MNTGQRSRLRSILLMVVGLLYVVSIPWYREPGAEAATLFGLPSWVAVALGCYVTAAVLNAVAWLLTEVPDAVPGDASDGPTQ